MKKWFYALLCVSFLFGCTACQGSVQAASVASAPAPSSESAKEASSAPETVSSEVYKNESPTKNAAASDAASQLPSSGNSASSQTQIVVSSEPALPRTVTVTIPEGYTFAQICQRLESKGVCTAEKLMATINAYDFSYYPLIGLLSPDPNRCFKLEGYLYPDTYEFYTGDKPENVLGKFLRNAENRITETQRQAAEMQGMTVDQLLTLASVIEKEASSAEEMKNISSVFHNRLETGMRLEADPTITYIETYVKPYITGDINRYNSYYNTYKCSALPEGPICNPGQNAIDAVLNPTSTEYLYFVSDKEGSFYYATTYEQHLENCKNIGIVLEEPPAAEE